MNGRVIAFITTSIDVTSSNRSDDWTWFDVATIAEDGTFAFESLPRGDVVQMISVCDGWVSKTPNEDVYKQVVPWLRVPGAASFTLPQPFVLDEKTIDAELEMEPTATCEVTVLDPDGKPLPDAKIAMWPNQAFLGGGSTILGSGISSADSLRMSEKELRASIEKQFGAFHAETNEKGVAVIKNLPGTPNQGLAAMHDDFEQGSG